MGNAVCCSLVVLSEDEYARAEGPTTKKVIYGPSCGCLAPWYSISKNGTITIGQEEYLVVDTLEGTRRVVEGPNLYKPESAYETISGPIRKIILQSDEYAIIQDNDTGEVRTLQGDCVYTPKPLEVLQEKKKKLSLTSLQYAHIRDEQSGDLRTLIGPLRYEPGPYDTIVVKGEVTSLNHKEYIRVLDTETGKLRIVRGEAKFIPSHTDELVEGPKEGTLIDEHTAVIVRDTREGSLSLVTKKQLFVPGPNEEVEEVVEKTILEEYEVMILIDPDGAFIVKDGRISEQRSFFIPPLYSILEQEWSVDVRMEHDHFKTVNKFDMRPSYMNYEFLVRTTDSVELIVDVAFFWQITDIQKLISQTGDPPRDLCNYARSVIVETVSHHTMTEFVNNYRSMIEEGVEKSKNFYDERGVIVHHVNVQSIKCADEKTEAVLQEIIQETTNRLNKRQKQESDNEVKLFKMRGEIEEEKLKGELLQIRHSHMRNEAEMEGQAEGDRVTAFLDNMPASLSLEDKMAFFSILRSVDRVKEICNSEVVLYLTPEQCDVEISRDSEREEQQKSIMKLGQVQQEGFTV